MKKVKFLLVLLVGLLPAHPVKNALLNRLGHQIHPTAKLGPVLLVKVLRIEIGARTHVWGLSTFRNLRGVRIGTDATMMRFNTVWALPGFRKTGAADPVHVGILSMGNDTLVTKGHDLDCSGGFIMEEWSAIAGRETLVYTHSYDPSSHTLSCAPTRLEEGAFIAARTTVAMGAVLPHHSVLAMGGVLMPGATKPNTLYGGVPARPVKDISDWAMMDRRDTQRPPMQG